MILSNEYIIKSLFKHLIFHGNTIQLNPPLLYKRCPPELMAGLPAWMAELN
jgi:hypothetical protein